MTRRLVGLWVLILVLALMGIGTISNQVRINRANAVLSQQASDGAKALARSCKLAGVSKKIYVDNLQRKVITSDDFALFTDTLQQACAGR